MARVRMFGIGAAVSTLIAAAGLVGCDDGGGQCDSVTTVWSGDAEVFFQNYCLECHSTGLTGGDRNDAPNGLNFDTYADLEASDIGETQAEIEGGSMPPSDASAQPSQDEVDAIVAWLSCGATEQ